MSTLSGARVLVTGSQGFTGAHIKNALHAKGAKVFGISEFEPGPDEVKANLLDKDGLLAAVREIAPNFVLHLAAIANVAHSDNSDFYKINVLGTCNLLDALVASKLTIRHVILASSANIYGNFPVSPVSESASPSPVNHYAMSKLAMEFMAKTYADRLPISFTRPFNYTGPGQSEAFLIPKIVGHFKRKESVIELGNLNVEREFNDIRFVASAYAGLLESASSGHTVNICTGHGHALLSVIDTMKAITCHQIEVRVNPAFVRPNELKSLVGDGRLLRDLVPNLPNYALEETLRWMLS